MTELNSPQWRRYTFVDGACSAEFPQSPKNETDTKQGVELVRLTLTLPAADATYRVSSVAINPVGPPLTEEERLDSARDALAFQPGCKFIREENISQNELPGRYLEFALNDKYSIRTKVFIGGAKVYQIMAVTPLNTKEDEATKRFLNSFRFEKSKE